MPHSFPMVGLLMGLAGGEAESRTFCIVGAGPGGVQLGQYFSTSRAKELRDYVIFERASGAGAFFRRYPVHRELISINKRFHSPGHAPEYPVVTITWVHYLGPPGHSTS